MKISHLYRNLKLDSTDFGSASFPFSREFSILKLREHLQGKKGVEWYCINDSCVSNGRGIRVAHSHSFSSERNNAWNYNCSSNIFWFRIFSSAICQESGKFAVFLAIHFWYRTCNKVLTYLLLFGFFLSTQVRRYQH